MRGLLATKNWFIGGKLATPTVYRLATSFKISNDVAVCTQLDL